MRIGRALTLGALCLLASACYRQVVNTGMTPGPTVIEKPWTSTWVWGLVPATPIDVTQQCPAGLATVTTQMSVANFFGGLITAGIWSPRSVSITCASGRALLGTPAVHVARTASDSERQAAFAIAAEMSEQTGKSVLIRF